MNIICDKSILSNAIDGVAKAVALRSSIPVLEGILLKADGFQLTLTGYDLQMAIITSIEANVLEPGEVVLNAKLLSDIVHRMPTGNICISVTDHGVAFIKGEVAEFEMQSLSAFDYPDLPNPEAEPTTTIKAAFLEEIIELSLYAVSQDDKKPAHTGELFEFAENKLSVVALDGFRLAIVEREVFTNKEIRIIIPGKTMNEVKRLLPADKNEDIHISANRRFVVFNMNGYTIISRLIEGEFLNYRSVIPQSYLTKVIIDVKPFIESIERASLIITERVKNPLRIFFENGRAVIRCQTNLGKVMDEIEVEIEGDNIEIGFNNRYLLDALRSSAEEKVVLEITGPLNPVKVIPQHSERFTFLVLPVRFKNEVE